MSILKSLESDFDFDKKEIWINEAKFGYNYIRQYLDSLDSNSRVLEVGCGSGILLTMVKEYRSSLNVEGIEPFGSGFSQLKKLNRFVKNSGANIHNVAYEEFYTESKFDLIYCINVFEHLNDWRRFLGFVKGKLSTTGKCLILCPNYFVPYESHFRIPIIFNKKITFYFFKRYIKNFEKEKKVEGLWESLNFVSLPQVKSSVQKLDQNFKANYQINIDLIDRLALDEKFNERQKIIGVIGKFVKSLGILYLFRLPFFENFQPYMMIEITNKQYDV